MSSRAPSRPQAEAAQAPLIVGQPFAPYKTFKGPVVPIGLFELLESDAFKIYVYLLNAFGNNSWTQRKYSTIAKETGMSEDRSGRAMSTLEDMRLIRRERQGPGKLSIIHLLWHPFLSSSLSKQGEKALLDFAKSGTLESAESRSQETGCQTPQNPGDKSPQQYGQDSAKSGGGTPHQCGEIKGKRTNLKDQFKGPSSSSTPPEPEATKKKTPPPSQSASQKPEAEAETPRWWHGVHRQGLQDQLNLVKPSALAYPAVRDLESILADNFDGPEDFRNWITFVGMQDMSRAGSWAYFKRPAEDWKGQRAGFLAEQEQQRQRQVEWLEQQQRAAMQAAIDIKARQPEWCRACALEEPCEKHGTSVPVAPSPESRCSKRDQGEPTHVQRARLSSELAFQREQADCCRVESLREWATERVRAIEAELAALDQLPNDDGDKGSEVPPEGHAAEKQAVDLCQAQAMAHTHRKPAGNVPRCGDLGQAIRAGAALKGIAV